MRAIETLDETVAALATALLLLSAASAAVVLHLRFRSSRSRRRNRLLGLNSLWPVRLLLVLFASLWALAELLRLPLLLRLLPLSLPLRYDPTPLCLAHVFAAHALAEPCFFATLLFLVRASNQPKSSSSATPAAFAAALATAIPFLILHALFLYLPVDFLRRVGIPVDLLGPPSFAYRVRLSADATEARCTYPLFGAVLLAALSSVYVPLFVSACWGAVSVVINKRLRVRLYALAGAVVVALCVQVATLALSALWDPGKVISEGLKLAAFVAVSCCSAAGEVILVFQPVLEALAIVDPDPPGTESEDDVMGIDAAGFGDG